MLRFCYFVLLARFLISKLLLLYLIVDKVISLYYLIGWDTHNIFYLLGR